MGWGKGVGIAVTVEVANVVDVLPPVEMSGVFVCASCLRLVSVSHAPALCLSTRFVSRGALRVGCAIFASHRLTHLAEGISRNDPPPSRRGAVMTRGRRPNL